jgi:hypothetical protein
LQEATSEDAEASARSGTAWMLIGATLTLLLWLTLSTLAAPVGARLIQMASGAWPGRPLVPAAIGAVPTLVAFAASAAFSGGILGYFGPRAGMGHVAGSALLAAGSAVLLSAFLAGVDLAVLVGAAAALVSSGIFSAWMGWKVGRKRRP